MNSPPEIAELVLSTGVLFVLAGSTVLWFRAFGKLSRGQPLVAYEPRELPPWGLLDLLLTIVIAIGFQQVAALLLRWHFQFPPDTKLDDLDPAQKADVLLLSSLANLLAAGISVLLVYLRHRPSWADFGCGRQVMKDLKLGTTAFLMLAPLIYLIQMVLTYWFESRHPLIELLKGDDGVRFLALSGFAALVVAPLAEEYVFRVLLQGWLERLAARRTDSELLMGGRRIDFSEPEPVAKKPKEDPVPHWPIVVSSLLFALAHYTHGPDPIPLFVLAFALGYLFHRTHRILPCIVVHFLLNATSLGVVWIIVIWELN